MPVEKRITCRALESRDERLPVAAELLRSSRRREPGSVLPLSGDPMLSEDQSGRPLEAFIAEVENRPAGVATVTRSGNISELALDPNLSSRDSQEAGQSLLEAAETWARERGAPEINFFRASGRGPSDSDLARFGYRQVAAPSTTLKVVNFVELLARIADGRRPVPIGARKGLSPHDSALPEQIEGFSIRMTVTDRPVDARDRSILVRADDAGMSVAVADSESVSVEMTVSARTLTEFLFRVSSTESFTRSVHCDPEDLADHSIAILSRLRIASTWVTPLGDRR